MVVTVDPRRLAVRSNEPNPNFNSELNDQHRSRYRDAKPIWAPLKLLTASNESFTSMTVPIGTVPEVKEVEALEQIREQ